MYPKIENKKYPTYVLKDTWDEPFPKSVHQKPIRNKWLDDDSSTNTINSEISKLNPVDLLKYIYEYVNTHFDQIGHHVPIGEKFESWWHRHNYGTSYQPIVQCCYIRKGRKLGYSVREHHSQKRITELALGIHGVQYDRETKMKSYNHIDVCWGINDNCFDSNSLTLALEYEDSGKTDDLFDELYLKLIHTNSKFRVLGARLNLEPDIHLINQIENKLNKDGIDKTVIFIFIAPDSISNPTKICFSEYVYKTGELKRVDDDKYVINITSKTTLNGTLIQKTD